GVVGARPAAEVVLAYAGETVVGFALFFHNFSTFLGRPGLYLEDLFVIPEWRGRGIGRMLMAHLAEVAVGGGWIRRNGMVGPGLERVGDSVLPADGCAAHERVAAVPPHGRQSREGGVR